MNLSTILLLQHAGGRQNKRDTFHCAVQHHNEELEFEESNRKTELFTLFDTTLKIKTMDKR